MSELFQEIYDSLLHGNELVVATVIRHSGSTPRTSGSDMIVHRDGSISGTIGGGIIESNVIQSAMNNFATRAAVISSFDLNRSGRVDDMDLVCGGKMQILIEHISADKQNLEMFGGACEEIAAARPFFWIGRLTEDGRQWRIDRTVLTADGTWLGSLPEDPALQEKLNGFGIGHDDTALIDIDNNQYVVSTIQPPDTAYIIGAGHVAKEIALLTKQVGFRTLVFDDRVEFANTERFPDVDGVYVCNDFAGVFDRFVVTPGSHIVIVTRGHRFDREVLAQALRTEAGYIGMIGSRKKRGFVYSQLQEEGFGSPDLERVYCPIGLAIEAETPAEIAVSIVAQMIHHRARRKKNG